MLQAKSLSDSSLRLRQCFNCENTLKKAYLDLRCCGETAAGSTCKAQAIATGDCVLLPQVSAAAAGDTDPVLMMELDEGEPMVRFDPCGHTLSLDSFVNSVTSALSGGDARFQIKRSALGVFVLCCPVREPGRPCEASFVHDVHHYKLVRPRHPPRQHWPLTSTPES